MKYRVTDGVFYGNILNGRPEGKGTLVFDNGDKYIGDFQKGYMHGYGECFYNNGNHYIGYWSYSKHHGIGTLTYSDGTIYEGRFCNGLRHGRCLMFFQDRKIYNGFFENNHQIDEGTYYFDDTAVKMRFFGAGKKPIHIETFPMQEEYLAGIIAFARQQYRYDEQHNLNIEQSKIAAEIKLGLREDPNKPKHDDAAEIKSLFKLALLKHLMSPPPKQTNQAKNEEPVNINYDYNYHKNENFTYSFEEKEEVDKLEILENQAIEHYNNGMMYYQLGQMLYAKWEFEEALNTYSYSNFIYREDCEEMIEKCNEHIF